MTKAKIVDYTVSNRERGLLAVSVLIMLGTTPFTYIFFLLPLLNLPIALLAILVATKTIRNQVAVRAIEVFAILGTLFAIWMTGILLNYLGS